MPPKIVEGLYEDLVTGRLSAALDHLAPTRADLRKVDESDLPTFLAKHIGREAERALREVDGVDAQLALAEGLLRVIAAAAPEVGAGDADVVPPARLLTAVYRNAAPLRPSTPLTSSTLLTRNRAEPALSLEIGRELESADAVDLLAAFITLPGVRAVREPLERFARRGGTSRRADRARRRRPCSKAPRACCSSTDTAATTTSRRSRAETSHGRSPRPTRHIVVA